MIKHFLNKLVVLLLLVPLLGYARWVPIGTGSIKIFVPIEAPPVILPPGAPGDFVANNVVHGVIGYDGRETGSWLTAWGKSSGHLGYYQLYERAAEGAWGVKYEGLDANTVVTNITVAGHYTYKVRAVNNEGASDYNTEFSITYLDSVAQNVTTDIDGNGIVDHGDGILLSRYQAGIRGAALIAGLFDRHSSVLNANTIVEAIEQYNRISRGFPNAPQTTIDYVYDVHGRLTNVADSTGKARIYTYDKANNRTNVTSR